MKKNLKWILIAIAALVLVFFLGRMTAPTKVETITEVKWKEKIVEVEKESVKEAESKKEDKDKMYVKIVREKPDGTKETETKVIDKGTIEVGKVKESEKEKKVEKETVIVEREKKVIVREKPDWHVSLTAGYSFSRYDFSAINSTEEMKELKGSSYSYGLHVQRRVIGDVFVGAWGNSKKSVGLSVGMSL